VNYENVDSLQSFGSKPQYRRNEYQCAAFVKEVGTSVHVGYGSV